jgi:hypothetical protein
MAPINRTASSAAMPSAESPSATFPSSGRRMSRGTTARSCTTSIPMMTRLDKVPNTSCSVSVFSTTAVEEIESRAPNQTASCHPSPSREATP